MSGTARAGLVLVAIAAVAGAYVWWNSPERRIRRVLAAVEEAISHDAPSQGLAAAGSAARLQGYFATDVIVEGGGRFPALTGRDAVIAAAAKALLLTPALRLEFEDTRVAVGEDGTSATVDCTAMVTVTETGGQESVDAREVMMTLRLVDGRWVIGSARVVEVLERVS